VDHDADGTLDFISGPYDPGDLYFFRGLGKGKYARVETLLDETKTPLVHHPEELKKYERLREDRASDNDETIHARVASFGSWPFPVDWDGDGDLDMLIGTFSGQLYRRMNEGSRKEPVFAAESIVVETDGAPLSGLGHCDPFVADWDGDGAWDLVVGSSDGSVVWFRNVGSKTEPRFGPEQTLVEAKADSKFLSQYLEPGESPSPGVRAQICVVDYDRDGRLDLLVGDYSMLVATRDLDPEEEAELEEILRLQSEQGAALDSATDDAERAKIEAELKTLSAAKEQFLLPLAKDAKRPPASFVWFFRREAIGPSGSGR
jgi:hypothetical protein